MDLGNLFYHWLKVLAKSCLNFIIFYFGLGAILGGFNVGALPAWGFQSLDREAVYSFVLLISILVLLITFAWHGFIRKEKL